MFKSKFYSKCKSGIKATRTRIELIMRKRSVMEKYLKNDIADLLKNGHDSHAYGRAEGLLAEQKLSDCYNLVEQACEFILSNLSTMDKQTECPEECREAVATLMFAAARFADLPELRELRSIFSERYGNFLEAYVKKEFVEKSKTDPSTKDAKLQLLQEIALEYGLEWDSKSLEQKLYIPPASVQEFSRKANDDKYTNLPKDSHQNVWRMDRKDSGLKHSNSRDSNAEENIEKDLPRGWNLVKKETRAMRYTSSRASDQTENRNPLDLKSIPPPYVKTVQRSEISENITPTASVREQISGAKENDHADGGEVKGKPVPRSVRRIPPNVMGRSRSSEERQKDSKTGLRFLTGEDQRDEEERMIDKLLMHYSKKPSPSLPNINGEVEGLIKQRSEGSVQRRTNSLLAQPANGPLTGATKGHTRAASLQPDMLREPGHVHPKLPDYDDFVARLAELRKELK